VRVADVNPPRYPESKVHKDVMSGRGSLVTSTNRPGSNSLNTAE
jgi:hypothetical protein